MVMLINPGSHIGPASEGWTNTYAKALEYAKTWFLDTMRKVGFQDIELIETHEADEGRWKFIFKHRITGVEVELWTHGIDDLKAYEKAHIFTPRVYWNGSSSSNPDLEEFKADGFEPVLTYRPVDKNVYDEALKEDQK
jgi:hypothetical protein